MKKVLILTFLFLSLLSIAQVPQAINYQAVVRDNAGNVVANHTVSLQIKIHQGSPNGTVVYTEADTVATNQFGLVMVVIGLGNPVMFSAISWGSGTYYNEVGLDINGGNNYQSMGNSQLVSVPYALYAQTAGNAGATGPTGATGPQGPIGPAGSGGSSQQNMFLGYGYVNNGYVANTFQTSTQEPNSDSIIIVSSYFIYSAQKDAGTGEFIANILVNSAGNGLPGYAGATSYQGLLYYSYVSSGNTWNIGCTNGQTITLSGAPMPSGGTHLLFSDGTYVYLHNSGNTWIKFSGGNTWTNQGTLILGNTGNSTKAVMCDGTNIFSLEGTIVSKYALTGGNAISTKSFGASPGYGAYPGFSGFANINASLMYLAQPNYCPTSQPTLAGQVTFTPFSKP